MMNTWISRQLLAGFVVVVVLLVADAAYCQLHVQAEVVINANAQAGCDAFPFAAPQASPATAPSTKPTTLPAPSADFTLHEWAIFVAEPRLCTNSVAAIKSTLPSFVVSRRPDAEGDDRGVHADRRDPNSGRQNAQPEIRCAAQSQGRRISGRMAQGREQPQQSLALEQSRRRRSQAHTVAIG